MLPLPVMFNSNLRLFPQFPPECHHTCQAGAHKNQGGGFGYVVWNVIAGPIDFLDAGDVNGNQKAEIFVTRLDGYGKLDSTVLEWNGKTLEPISDHQPWYFRIVRDPLEGPVLVGQRQGSRSANDTGGLYAYTHFLPGVVALTWIEGNYQAGARLPLPADMDLYRFTPGDIFNDGATRYIAYSPSDELRVYDASGQPQWAGQETLGGSPKYLESPSLTDSRTKDRTYLAQRLEVADLDGDGNVEVITVHNRDATRGWVERFRKYTRGRMIALRWNQVGMEPVWNGEEAGGYISDFCVADVDGDNRWEAVYALVTSSGITQTETSHIVVEPIVSLFLE